MHGNPLAALVVSGLLAGVSLSVCVCGCVCVCVCVCVFVLPVCLSVSVSVSVSVRARACVRVMHGNALASLVVFDPLQVLSLLA